MIYFSQLLNQKIYHKKMVIGKIVDASVYENLHKPPISKVIIKLAGTMYAIPSRAIDFNSHPFFADVDPRDLEPYDKDDFYLNEDLLDKQIIDIQGKRLARVNDIALEQNGGFKVLGIDIGFSALLRRLGFPESEALKPRIIPWNLIEAFDYESGNVRIKLEENRLNKLHPADLADILEEVGVKERLGILTSISAPRAAQAIEETNNQTQQAILEQLPLTFLRNIVDRMRISEIADVLPKINPLKVRHISAILGKEKTTKIEKLLRFPNDTAGGLMSDVFHQIDSSTPVKQALERFLELKSKPEAFIVTTDDEYKGIVYLKDLVEYKKGDNIHEYIRDIEPIEANSDFSEVFTRFSQYNLRILPVIDKNKKIIGVIQIDVVLAKIQEEKEENDVF